jgi:hypothetical protein
MLELMMYSAQHPSTSQVFLQKSMVAMLGRLSLNLMAAELK